MRATAVVPHRRHGPSLLPRPLRRAAAALLLGLAPVAARADELPTPFPAAVVPETERESDAFLLRKVNAALAVHPAVTRLDLVVSVVDRVAVVGGAVPDAALIPKIKATVEGVPGLAAVKVSCWAVTPPDPFAERLADQLRAAVPPAVATNPRVPPLALGPARPGAVPADPVVPPVVAAKAPAPEEPEPRTAAKMTMEALSGPSPTDAFLLDPVAVVRRPAGLRVAPLSGPGYPTIPPPAVPVRPVSDPRPADPVAAARTSDPRFAGLTVSLKEGTAVVGGRAARASDVWAFADLLRTVPGVARVVVKDVK